VMHDRRRVGRHVRDELDFDAIRTDEVREVILIASKSASRVDFLTHVPLAFCTTSAYPWPIVGTPRPSP
jgi:hypothetical protein